MIEDAETATVLPEVPSITNGSHGPCDPAGGDVQHRESLRGARRMRALIAALAAAGVAALVIAALVGSGGPSTGGSAVTAGPAVDRVIPEPGDEVLQQQRVGVVLDPRYRLTSLVVYPNDRLSGGVNVFDEVVQIAGLNSFEFAPGEGRLLESLSPDTNCVRATFVLIARPEESDTTQWCFQVS